MVARNPDLMLDFNPLELVGAAPTNATTAMGMYVSRCLMAFGAKEAVVERFDGRDGPAHYDDEELGAGPGIEGIGFP